MVEHIGENAEIYPDPCATVHGTADHAVAVLSRRRRWRRRSGWRAGGRLGACAVRPAILAPMPATLIEFPADDPERALRFWRGVLGTELAPRSTAKGSGWETARGDLRLGVHERGSGPGDTASLPYFTVADIGQALDRVAEFGGSIIHPGERWAICRDSEGSPFALEAAQNA
jgi:predicted enzyme related to lactoylglutathione lyase